MGHHLPVRRLRWYPLDNTDSTDSQLGTQVTQRRGSGHGENRPNLEAVRQNHSICKGTWSDRLQQPGTTGVNSGARGRHPRLPSIRSAVLDGINPSMVATGSPLRLFLIEHSRLVGQGGLHWRLNKGQIRVLTHDFRGARRRGL
jgi:hypothetical protein